MLPSWAERSIGPIATLPHSHSADHKDPQASGCDHLAVVTVAHHSQAVLPGLAQDLAGQSPGPTLWLLVDNSPESAPLQLEPLRKATAAGQEGRPPGGPPLEIRLVIGREGDGFAAGCNRALDALRASGWQGWVWLLNPDTALPRGDELAQLRRRLAGLPPTTLVGTAVDDGQGRFEANGGWIAAGLDFRGRRLQPHHRRSTTPVAVDWLSGCSLALLPTAHLPEARFDPLFPLYYEDMDLCLRLGQAGASVLWLPLPAVVHRRGTGSEVPSPRRQRLSTLSYLRFLKRHCAGWVVVVRSLRLLLLSLVRLPLRPRRSLAVLGAMAEVVGIGLPQSR